jgi:SAM-dependent methyltransferase
MRTFNETKQFFETPGLYLNNNYGIRTRQYILAHNVFDFLKEKSNILDVGCGDGSLSEMFTDRANEITLLDISHPMLEIAKKRFFDRDFRKIKIINERLEDISIDAKFDLIIVVGVVAHVQNTFMFLEKCKSFLAEEGILILQFTEASHFIVKYNNFIHKIFQRPRVRDHRWEELNIIFSELNLLIIKKIKFGFYPRGIKFMNGQTVFKIQKFLYNKKINFLLHDRMLILKNRGNS